MNAPTIRKLPSLGLVLLCILVFLCQGATCEIIKLDDHFQPFLKALSLQISPNSTHYQFNDAKTVSNIALTRIQNEFHQNKWHNLPIRSSFARISPNRVQNPNKLSLFRGKRPSLEIASPFESNVQELKLSLKYLSSLNRFDPSMKYRARQYILDTFRNFGLNTTKQHFRAPNIENEGINLIGIRKGSARLEFEKNSRRGIHLNDRVLVIGAHYDVVNNTSGLNDNGSGIGVMLELVRLLEHCQTKYSIIFVAFDLEELGAIGSKYFVHEYLIPNELTSSTYRSQYKGAIIMDTLLNFDAQPGTQDIPNDMHLNVPEFSAAIKKSNYSGDFLAMFARSSIDQQIARLIEEKWRKFDQRHRLKPADSTTSTSEQDWQKFHLKPVSIRSLGKGKVTSTEDLHKHINMLRSDHLHFWYHNHSSYAESLSAVLLTDTGPFRGYMRYCYHKMCDDSRFLTESNVAFVKKTVDVLLAVALQIAEGKCSMGENNLERVPDGEWNEAVAVHGKHIEDWKRKKRQLTIINPKRATDCQLWWDRPSYAVRFARRLFEVLKRKAKRGDLKEENGESESRDIELKKEIKEKST